jgi:hypothetical protein
VLGVDRLGEFIVGTAAPTIEMRSRAGVASDSDDNTVEFEDFAGSVVVLLAPAPGGRDAESAAVAILDETRRRTGAGAAFLVAARTASDLAGLVDTSDSASDRIGAVDLVPGDSTSAFPDAQTALVVIDRHGRVAWLAGEPLPGPDQLTALVLGLEVEP